MSRKTLVTIMVGFCGVALADSAGAQTVTRGPYLQRGTPTRLVVRWRTSSSTNSRVLYGSSPGNLINQANDPASTTEHVVELINLSPETTYYYAVGSSSQVLAGNDANHFFVTPPSAGTSRPVRVWAIGDAGTANSDARAVRDAFLGLNGGAHAEVWLMLGDNAYSDGTDSQYQNAVFDTYPSLLRQSVLWPTLGNHDGHSASSDSESGPYYDIFTLPRGAEAGGVASGTEAYYSFDYANIHFICLDSYDSNRSPGGPMLTWLESDLAATTQDWIVAFWHHPPYTKGSHDSDSEGSLRDMREDVLPILESYGVDLVLSGHSHSYERSFQVHGHYGQSGSLTSSMLVNSGDGREDGDGAYIKNATGAVYAVAGSSGKTSGGSLNHPVMFASLSELGSMVLDFDGSRLDVTFLRDTGAVDDYLTILKGNQPPTADAGEDRAVVLPASVSLDGTAEDDFLPNPPGVLSTLWTKVSGPGAVTFGDASALDTTASFSVDGDYVLRLTADDGAQSVSDEMNVTAYPAGTPNQPPQVSAGQYDPVLLTAALVLSGSVVDEGLPDPPAAVTTTWSKVSGPGAVTFGNAGALQTTAIFSSAGTYVLRLTGDDGGLVASDDAAVTVNPAPQVVDIRVSASSDDAEEKPGGSMGLTSSDLELVFDGGDQTVGMRFNGVAIPQGATVVDAYVQFQVDETFNAQNTSLSIEGQAADNPPTFTSSSNNISSRLRTPNPVPWTPATWATVGAASAAQRTPNIASIIDTIVKRTGWSSGNSVVILISGTGERVAESFNGDQSGAPLLHVDYTTGPPPNQAPSVSAGPDQAITPPGDTTLTGTLSDDGLPSPPTLTTTWSQDNGPAGETATFADPGAVSTTVTFPAKGTYVLRLTADDGALTASDTVTVIVDDPPNVDAGPDDAIVLPAGALLDGTVSDDGIPNPPGTVTTTWAQVSGPGTVGFANASAVDTTASFSSAGTYVLRLTADDGALTASDTLTVVVAPQNLAPSVGAGPDQVVVPTAGAALNGTVTDDGLPNPPGTFTTTWAQMSGPGTVTFADANAVDTTATLPGEGTFVLRLTADDTELDAWDEVTITAASNLPPVVSIAAVPTITLPGGATLDGTVSDDGLPNPPATVTTTWSTVSGPGTVTFANASAVDTAATFSAAGTYVLRLTANDAQFPASADVSVVVNPAPLPPQVVDVRVSASSDDAEEKPGGSVGLTSSDLELVFDGGDQQVGMRFNGLAIPQGATVVDAYVQFQVDETTSPPNTSLSIEGQAADNASTFSSSSNNISSRPRTPDPVSWTPPSWPSTGATGIDQRTPNIASIIDTIVKRTGWSSGNSLVIIISGTGERVAESFNGDQSGAPLLHVEFSTVPLNQPPSVSAGSDRSVTPPDAVSLDGTVGDDGLPNPPEAVTATWAKASGPGTVTFADPNAVDTTASFSADGTYVLRLTADDTELSAWDEVTIAVGPNQAPSVSIAPVQTATLATGATLDGTVDDDGLPDPPAAVTTTWSQVSGPGTANFTDASAVDTDATFSVDGTYVLRLTAEDTADDSGLSTSADVSVTVDAAPPVTQTLDIRVSANSDDAEEGSSGGMDLGSSDLEMIQESSNQTVGMRFNGVAIPPGATIVSAYIQFQVDESGSQSTSLLLAGQAVDDAPTFTSSSGNISSRSRTAAPVPWTPPSWTQVGAAGVDQRTSEIASIIDKIVSRPGWSSGNSLVIIVTGTGKRVAESFNGVANAAPLLHVEYYP